MTVKSTSGDSPGPTFSAPKTAFLCSRNIPASAVLKCYDWAIEQRENGTCVLSGFQSKIEKDVFHYLIKGSQPLIIALARGLKKRLEQPLIEAIEQNRLLIISPFPEEVERITAETSMIRNRLMLELADKIVFGFISKNGNLDRLKSEFEDKKDLKFL